MLPNNQLYVGGTQSGKSSLFLSSLNDVDANYSPRPSYVLFYYQCNQESYQETRRKLNEQGVRADFIQGDAVTIEDIKKANQEAPGGQILLCIDDATLTTTKSPELANISTVCRHYNTSLVLMWHTLYAGWLVNFNNLTANFSFFCENITDYCVHFQPHTS